MPQAFRRDLACKMFEKGVRLFVSPTFNALWKSWPYWSGWKTVCLFASSSQGSQPVRGPTHLSYR